MPAQPDMPTSGAGDEPREDPTPIEILARFARTSAAASPRGVLHVEGREPAAFHGWMELMAIVEAVLGEPPAP